MDTKLIVGLDFGTQSARGILVDALSGDVLAERECAYPHGVIAGALPGGPDLPDSWALQDAMDYVACLDAIVPELSRAADGAGAVAGLGIAFTSCTLLPIDEMARPLSALEPFRAESHAYVKLWKHHGAQRQADRIDALLEAEGSLHGARFGGRTSSELLLAKALQIAEEAPHVYAAADEILEAGDWLTRLLTGSQMRSASFAGYKAWWNGGYPDAFQKIDARVARLVPDKMPGGVCPVGRPIGHLSPHWARRLRLPEGIAVAPSVIDSHAGVVGSGVASPDRAYLALGTSSVLIRFGAAPFSERGVYGGFPDGILPGWYAYESGVAAVGDLFQWYAERAMPAECAAEAERRGVAPLELMAERAARLEIAPRSPMALDWWNGDKTPFVDSELTGALFGLTLQTRPEEIFYALMESTAFAAREIWDICDAHGAAASELVCSGGIARKNPLMLRIYADVLQRPVRVAAANQPTALGAAIYAALAAGIHPDCGTAVRRIARVSPDVVLPDAGRADACAERYRAYCRIRDVSAELQRRNGR